MTNNLRQIDLDKLATVTGGKNPPKPGGDGDSIARHDGPFKPLEDALKGKTKGQG